ncbi:hypothetical protein [Nocardia nova]|uniref:hypothetical protein n=1 Tax=Nocardia nova TaxID=37330 RepID=UPI0033CCD1CC
MQIRSAVLAGVLTAMTALTVVGAGQVAAAPVPVVSAAPIAAEPLTVPLAQQIIRTVVDPATSPADAAGLVASNDPALGDRLHGFAVSASNGGYTPSVFTATDIRPTGDDTATATVTVTSPHAPLPIPVPFDYVYADGAWKLTADAAAKLLSFAR